MKIRSAELREIHLRLKERFEISTGGWDLRRILLLRMESEDGEAWSILQAFFVADARKVPGKKNRDTLVLRHLRNRLIPGFLMLVGFVRIFQEILKGDLP